MAGATSAGAKVEASAVTAEQVLHDALHHIRKGWVKGEELLFGEGVNDRIIFYGQKRVSTVKKLVEAGDREVKVCAIGGIFLARTLLNENVTTLQQVRNDKVTQQALFLLATAVADFEGKCVGLDGNSWEMMVTRFNDAKRPKVRSMNSTTRTTELQDVEDVFSTAIGLAKQLGL